MFDISSSVNYVCEVRGLLHSFLARQLAGQSVLTRGPGSPCPSSLGFFLFPCSRSPLRPSPQPDQNPSDFCCCSSASYTLFQACRSCQAGALPTANSTSPDQTYSDYLHSCPAGITTNASLASNLSSSGLASWAFRPIPASGTWDYAGAQANATKEGRWRAAGASTGLSSGAKAGVAVAVILVVAIGAVLFYKHVVPRIRCVLAALPTCPPASRRAPGR